VSWGVRRETVGKRRATTWGRGHKGVQEKKVPLRQGDRQQGCRQGASSTLGGEPIGRKGGAADEPSRGTTLETRKEPGGSGSQKRGGLRPEKCAGGSGGKAPCPPPFKNPSWVGELRGLRTEWYKYNFRKDPSRVHKNDPGANELRLGVALSYESFILVD